MQAPPLAAYGVGVKPALLRAFLLCVGNGASAGGAAGATIVSGTTAIVGAGTLGAGTIVVGRTDASDVMGWRMAPSRTAASGISCWTSMVSPGSSTVSVVISGDCSLTPPLRVNLKT